jgi:hypothetical protein
MKCTTAGVHAHDNGGKGVCQLLLVNQNMQQQPALCMLISDHEVELTVHNDHVQNAPSCGMKCTTAGVHAGNGAAKGVR